MKRVLLIFLVLLSVAGIGYLGYVLFNAKSIDKVEIVGDMQTLYIVGDDIDFEDAQLKVTYKNGDVKLVDLTEDRVTVSLFSTSLQTHGTMKLTYKSFDLDVEYDVINKGLYYVSSQGTINVNTDASLAPNMYNYSTSPMLFHLGDDGELGYYYKESGKYYLHDGVYDSSYKYKISGNSVKVYLGEKEVAYTLKANYSSEGIMSLKSTTLNKSSFDPDIVVSKDEKIYKFYEGFKTDRKVTSVKVDLSKTSYTHTASYDYITFRMWENIKTCGKVLLLETKYGNDTFMKTVYVYICDGMITRNSLDTDELTDLGFMFGSYEGLEFDINYKVILPNI